MTTPALTQELSDSTAGCSMLWTLSSTRWKVISSRAKETSTRAVSSLTEICICHWFSCLQKSMRHCRTAHGGLSDGKSQITWICHGPRGVQVHHQGQSQEMCTPLCPCFRSDQFHAGWLLRLCKAIHITYKMSYVFSPQVSRIDSICPLQFIKEHHFADYWPPIQIYVELVKIAAVQLRITEEEVRHRYWDASIKTWCKVLQISNY